MELLWLLLIPAAILIVIVVRLAAGGMDRDRIRLYIEERGGKVIDTFWEPFGPGWFGERSDRIYSVRYRDRDGNEHQAYCKTSMWSGVYLAEDRIVKNAASAPSEVQTLEAENQRLREELERLKRAQQQAEPGSDAIRRPDQDL
jgi:5-methylthioribose kinase